MQSPYITPVLEVFFYICLNLKKKVFVLKKLPCVSVRMPHFPLFCVVEGGLCLCPTALSWMEWLVKLAATRKFWEWQQEGAVH